MGTTVFFTILTGVLTYVAGQLVPRLLIEPVQELRRTIGQISHALIQYANVIANPGVPTKERMHEASDALRTLSSQLQSHLYLVPRYDTTAKVFKLPAKAELLRAAKALIGLSNSVFRASERVYEGNAKKVERVCDSLKIYLPEDEPWPDEASDA